MKKNFQTRLFAAFFLIAIPVIAVVIVGFLAILVPHANDTILKNQETEANNIGTQLDYVFKDVENLSREILYNSSVQSYLKKSLKGETYPSDTDTAYYINNSLSGREYIHSIVITGTDHTLFSTELADTDISTFHNIEHKWWFNQMVSGVAPFGWYCHAALDRGNYYPVRNNTSQKVNDIVLARPIYSMDDYQTRLGYVMIYLDNDYLNSIWESCDWGSTANILVYNPSGDLMMCNSKGTDYESALKQLDSENKNQLVHYDGENYLVSRKTIPTTDYQLYMITPYKEVGESSRLLQIEMWVLIAAVLLIMIFIGQFSSRNMAQPIIQLSRAMDASYHETPESSANSADPQGTGADGSSPTDSPAPETFSAKNILTEAPVADLAALSDLYRSRTDEIGQMYRSYEGLLNRLNLLIKEIYLKDLEKKDAELALLQSQISPHFLYNTLDSINWIALEHGEDEISDMITALSDTFRLSLMKNNSSFTEFSQELQYVKSYLILQKFRYEDRLNYTFDLPADLPELYIPRFFLQPIVENGIKHGIDRLEGGGTIAIRVFLGRDLHLTVSNDGTCIDLKKMERLLDYDPDDPNLLTFELDGYGIQNINRRIRILCGRAYGLSYSVQGSQTVCHITLPVKTTLV